MAFVLGTRLRDRDGGRGRGRAGGGQVRQLEVDGRGRRRRATIKKMRFCLPFPLFYFTLGYVRTHSGNIPYPSTAPRRYTISGPVPEEGVAENPFGSVSDCLDRGTFSGFWSSFSRLPMGAPSSGRTPTLRGGTPPASLRRRSPYLYSGLTPSGRLLNPFLHILELTLPVPVTSVSRLLDDSRCPGRPPPSNPPSPLPQAP